MKKTALLLVLALMIGVLSLAFSCTPAQTPATSSEEPAPASSEEPAPASSEEPAPAESSEEPAPVESSEEPEPTESSEEPEPVESSEEPEPDESSEEPEPAESTEEPPAGNGNLALNKSYTRSELFRMGGAEVDWGWDPNANEAYPDEGGISLTDGNATPADEQYGDPVWAGFHGMEPKTAENGYAFIRVDLGEKKSLKKFVIYAGSKKIGSGVSAPISFEVLVSNDGKEFESLGEQAFEDSDKEAYVVGELKKSAKGRYVEFRFSKPGGWMFISEVEVY